MRKSRGWYLKSQCGRLLSFHMRRPHIDCLRHPYNFILLVTVISINLAILHKIVPCKREPPALKTRFWEHIEKSPPSPFTFKWVAHNLTASQQSTNAWFSKTIDALVFKTIDACGLTVQQAPPDKNEWTVTAFQEWIEQRVCVTDQCVDTTFLRDPHPVSWWPFSILGGWQPFLQLHHLSKPLGHEPCHHMSAATAVASVSAFCVALNSTTHTIRRVRSAIFWIFYLFLYTHWSPRVANENMLVSMLTMLVSMLKHFMLTTFVCVWLDIVSGIAVWRV